MSDRDLLDIIDTLKTLQIQQQQIIERQQELTQQLDHILAGRGGDTANPHRVSTASPHTSDPSNTHRDGATTPVISGRISPTISHTNTIRPHNIALITGSSTRRRTFVLGEHVYITNRITHSITPGPLDQATIVTWVHPRRIDFRMLSGHETWRSPGNLRQLTDQEIAPLTTYYIQIHNAMMDGNPATVMSKLMSGTASTLGDTQSDVQRTSINEPVNHRRNRRRQSGRGHNWTPQSRFKSSVEGLEDVVYDCGLPNSSQDLFTTTTE